MRGIVSDKLKPFLTQVNQVIADNKTNNITLSVAQVRENLNNLQTLIGEGPEVSYVVNHKISVNSHQIPVRVYSPAPEQALPVVLHYHGGGHMCGSIELYDTISRKIATMGQCIVIAVEYRLAPEHPYPAGLDDCQQALMYYQQVLTEVAFSKQVIVLGDSAGGAICTTLAMQSLTNSALNIDKQILIYPSVDYTLCSDSIKTNGSGYLLETDKVSWYFEHYFQTNEDRAKASPLFGTINRKLPKTLIFTAGCDPLRDEGLAYAGALTATGVPVKHHHFDDLIHAYMLLDALVSEECQQTYQMIGEFIQQ
jgi:acetyl esterase/lipase